MARPWKDRLPGMWQQIMYSETPAAYAGHAYMGLKIKFNNHGALIDCETEGIDRGTSSDFPGLFFLMERSETRKIDYIGFGIVPDDLRGEMTQLFVPPGFSLSESPDVKGADLKSALPMLIDAVHCLNDDLSPDMMHFMGMPVGRTVDQSAKARVDTVYRRLCADASFRLYTLAPPEKEATQVADQMLTHLDTMLRKRKRTRNWAFSVKRSTAELVPGKQPDHIQVKREILMKEPVPDGVLLLREDTGVADLGLPSKDGCIFIAPRFSGRGSDAATRYAFRVFGGYRQREISSKDAPLSFKAMHDLVVTMSGYAQQSLTDASPQQSFFKSLSDGLAPFRNVFDNEDQPVTVCIPSRHVKKD